MVAWGQGYRYQFQCSSRYGSFEKNICSGSKKYLFRMIGSKSVFYNSFESESGFSKRFGTKYGTEPKYNYCLLSAFALYCPTVFLNAIL
jgi:hypothetical protein